MRLPHALAVMVLVVSSPAAPLRAQATPASASQAARAFFDMLTQGRWTAAASAVDSTSVAQVRESDLAMMIAWAHYRDEMRGFRQGKGSGGLSGGFSSSGHIDPALLAKYGQTPIPGFDGAPTLAAVAALPERTFLADILALHDTLFMHAAGERAGQKVTYSIVGAVIENDSIAHVLYRISGTQVQVTDPLRVNVLRLRRRADTWLVELTLFDFELLGGGAMFMEMDEARK
jgi:hypothetical protein